MAAASADGVVVTIKNLILLNYHPASAKPPAPLLNKEGSFFATHPYFFTLSPLPVVHIPINLLRLSIFAS